jgi:hypothetical protein
VFLSIFFSFDIQLFCSHPAEIVVAQESQILPAFIVTLDVANFKKKKCALEQSMRQLPISYFANRQSMFAVQPHGIAIDVDVDDRHVLEEEEAPTTYAQSTTQVYSSAKKSFFGNYAEEHV